MNGAPKSDLTGSLKNIGFESSHSQQKKSQASQVSLNSVARGLASNKTDAQGIIGVGANQYSDSSFRSAPQSGDAGYDAYQQELVSKGKALAIIYPAMAKALALPMDTQDLWDGNKLVVMWKGTNSKGNNKLFVVPYGDVVYLETPGGTSIKLNMTMHDLIVKLAPFKSDQYDSYDSTQGFSSYPPPLNLKVASQQISQGTTGQKKEDSETESM